MLSRRPKVNGGIHSSLNQLKLSRNIKCWYGCIIHDFSMQSREYQETKCQIEKSSIIILKGMLSQFLTNTFLGMCKEPRWNLENAR
jgi:hypothetical protein